MTRRRSLSTVVLAGVTATLATLVVPHAAHASAWITLSGQASPSGFPAGVNIYDSANLSGGTNPAGTLTFKLWGPGQAPCSGPSIFTSTKAVHGNGYYESDTFPSDQAGTYTWHAAYSGDSTNPPASTACGAASQAVTNGKRNPTLNTAASGVSSSGAISDTATLGNGSGPNGPTGTITFSLFGPDNMVCGGGPAFTVTKPVAGNGVYSSGPFTPTASGTYRWTSKYSGDANNFPASTICSDPAQSAVVTTAAPPPSTTTTTAPPTTTTTAPPTTTTTAPPRSAIQTTRFVERAFQDVLGRPASVPDLTSWVPLLDAGYDRSAFGLVLTSSVEFRRAVVSAVYMDLLTRPPDAPAVDAFINLLVAGWPLDLVQILVLGSEEFYVNNGSSAGSFVDALYARVLGWSPDPSGRTFWIHHLDQGMNRYDVAGAFINSGANHQNRVRFAYSWLLGRPVDAGSLDYWTTLLNNGLRQDHMYAYLIGSPEYWAKV